MGWEAGKRRGRRRHGPAAAAAVSSLLPRGAASVGGGGATLPAPGSGLPGRRGGGTDSPTPTCNHGLQDQVSGGRGRAGGRWGRPAAAGPPDGDFGPAPRARPAGGTALGRKACPAPRPRPGGVGAAPPGAAGSAASTPASLGSGGGPAVLATTRCGFLVPPGVWQT